MQDRFDDIRIRLEQIGEELTDLSVEVLRHAVEEGETRRPDVDKRIGQARRAVEKAARVLEARPTLNDEGP